MYHVTSKENVDRIWDDGLETCPPSEKWVEQRREMRKILDKEGNNMYSNWIDREGGLFFWPSYRKAKRYATRKMNPAIVEVRQLETQAWAIPNDEIEQFFEYYLENKGQHAEEDIRERARQVVSRAHPWNSERSEEHEVWLQPPISSDKIYEILDINGHPITDID